jgi:predicted amidophosphoribosyltransferase
VLPPASITDTTTPEPPKPACPKCGASLEPEERFCPNCGFDNQSIEVEPVSEKQIDKPLLTDDVVLPPASITETTTPEPPKPACPKCGASLEPEERFCAGCGFDTQIMAPSAPEIEVVTPVIPQDAVKSPEEKEKPISESGQFCPECGAAMLADDVFCQECGYKSGEVVVSDAAEKPAVPIPPPPVEPPVKVQVPPVVPPPVQPPVDNKNQVPKKKNKLLLVLLLVLLALGVLGGGGYFAYKKFFQNTAQTIATAPAPEETIPALTEAEEIQQPDTTLTMQPAETPVEKPESERKTSTSKTKPNKKKAEPRVIEPVKEEPAKPTGPVTVVMNQKTVKKSPRSLYTNYNTEEVKSGPKSTNRIKFDKPTMVTRIITFHHNDGKGAAAGTITLEGRKNEAGGPWQARNAPGSDGTLNGKWICEPNARMEAGTYKIEVSNENSWSYNGKSNRKGFVIVEGYELD